MKTMDFSKHIAACDLKIGRCRQLIEKMKVCEYSVSRILTLTHGHLHIEIKIFYSETIEPFFNQILYVSFKVPGNENSLTRCR